MLENKEDLNKELEICKAKEAITKANYTLKLHLIATLENIVSLICFTVLSVVFQHWWIILISCLFFTTVNYSDVK